MNASIARIALIAFALAGCAELRPTSDYPDTDLGVVDEGGTSVAGEYVLWAKGHEESCRASGYSCPVNVPEGDYNLTFYKQNSGGMAQAGGGNSGHDHFSGCLRARIHLVPGTAIKCKKLTEYNCAAGATETMDCGPARAAANHAPAAPATKPAVAQ